MKIQMTTSISSIGQAGEEVDVDAKLAKKLIDDGHALKAGKSEAPSDDKAAPPPPAPKTEMVENNDPKETT